MSDAKKTTLRERAFALARATFELYPRLVSSGAGHAHLARQLLSSVTAIGANLEEGAVAFSKRDMAAKYAIALREAREAHYWARLLATDPRWTSTLAPIVQETNEFAAMLTTAVRKLRAT